MLVDDNDWVVVRSSDKPFLVFQELAYADNSCSTFSLKGNNVKFKEGGSKIETQLQVDLVLKTLPFEMVTISNNQYSNFNSLGPLLTVNG